MRIYYVFDIKNEFVKLYKGNANTLYNILSQMYYMRKTDINYGYSLFKQIVNTQDKYKLDKYIYLLLHNKMKYSKKGNDHIINNLYKDEVSRLRINNFFMRLELDQEYSSFYEYLKNKEDNLFICNFKETDFFFLH